MYRFSSKGTVFAAYLPPPPSPSSSSTFKVAQAPVRARLFLSAQGLVEPWLNGTKVGNEYFTPGWPDYRERAYYVGYDVTDRIRAGDNTLGLILGDGWYSGQLLIKHQYGGQPLAAQWLRYIGVIENRLIAGRRIRQVGNLALQGQLEAVLGSHGRGAQQPAVVEQFVRRVGPASPVTQQEACWLNW